VHAIVSHRKQTFINLTTRIIPFIRNFLRMKTIINYTVKVSKLQSLTFKMFKFQDIFIFLNFLFSMSFAQVKDTTTVNKLDEVLVFYTCYYKTSGALAI
jgi:hypothetical protein